MATHSNRPRRRRPHLTDAIVRHLDPTPPRIVYDADLAGFGIRLSPTSRSWVAELFPQSPRATADDRRLADLEREAGADPGDGIAPRDRQREYLAMSEHPLRLFFSQIPRQTLATTRKSKIITSSSAVRRSASDVR
jgi:hypothetical protein